MEGAQPRASIRLSPQLSSDIGAQVVKRTATDTQKPAAKETRKGKVSFVDVSFSGTAEQLLAGSVPAEAQPAAAQPALPRNRAAAISPPITSPRMEEAATAAPGAAAAAAAMPNTV